MRSYLLLAGLILLYSSAGAREAVEKKIEQTADGYKLSLTFNDVKVSKAEGDWYKVDIKGSAHMLYPNVPQMPYMAYSFLTQGEVELEVSGGTYTDHVGYDVVPSKGNLSRTEDPSKIKPVAGALYQQNTFFPSKLATTAGDYMVREAHGQAIHVYPVQYNPVTHVLRIYHTMELVVKTELAQKPAEAARNVLWDNIYKRQFINYSLLEGTAAKSTYSAPTESGDMLIVTPGQYIANLQDFINWKKERGIRCLVMNIDTMSSGPDPDSIKGRIAGYYQQYGINYVQLIGDVADMPPIDDNSVAGPSDAAYTYISGNDHYPDLLIGRFSANNWMELEPQLYKSIEYEKNPTTAQAWYTRGLGAASNQGPGDDNQMDWEHMADLRMQLLAGTFTHIDEAYDGTHNITDAPLDLPGDPDEFAVIDAINTGVSLINYCGHGSSTSMATTGFGNGHVPLLTNTNGQWPFVLTVACVTGEFMNNTSLGERLMQASAVGSPYGMVAGFMSSINQSWDPPMQAQDEFNAIVADNSSFNIFAAAAMTAAGCMSMNDAYGGAGDDMTDAWIFFGDPSLQLRYDSSDILTAVHADSIANNVTALNVQLNKNYGTVVLLHADTIYSVQQTSNTLTAHNFASLATGDSLVVVATSPNTNPYYGKVYIKGMTTGLDQVAADNTISLYPNPVNGRVYIKGLESKARYRCLDVTGRVVKAGAIDNGANGIDTRELVPGSYILQLSTGKAVTNLPLQVLR